MSDQNWFFRTMWRLNAIVVALAGVAILWMAYNQMPYFLGHFWLSHESNNNTTSYTLRPPAQFSWNTFVSEPNKVLALARWDGDAPPPFLRQPLYGGGYFGLAAMEPTVVNLLIVDAQANKSRWVFQGTDRDILDVETLFGPPAAGAENGPAIGGLIHVLETDASSKKPGKQSIYVYRAEDQRAVKLITADVILDAEEVGSDRILIVYGNGSQRVSATYSLPDLKLESEQPLTRLPK